MNDNQLKFFLTRGHYGELTEEEMLLYAELCKEGGQATTSHGLAGKILDRKKPEEKNNLS